MRDYIIFANKLRGKMFKEKISFKKEDCGMTEDDFNLAIDGLIEKGLVKEEIIEGKIFYYLTDIGVGVGSHIESDYSNRN